MDFENEKFKVVNKNQKLDKEGKASDLTRLRRRNIPKNKNKTQRNNSGRGSTKKNADKPVLESMEVVDDGIYVQVSVSREEDQATFPEHGGGEDSDSESESESEEQTGNSAQDVSVRGESEENTSKSNCSSNQSNNASRFGSQGSTEILTSKPKGRLSDITRSEFEELLWANRDIVSGVMNGDMADHNRGSQKIENSEARSNRSRSKSKERRTGKTVNNQNSNFKENNDLLVIKSPSEATIYTQAVQRMNSSGEDSSDLSLNQSRFGIMNISDESADNADIDSTDDRFNIPDEPQPGSSGYRPPNSDKRKLPPTTWKIGIG